MSRPSLPPPHDLPVPLHVKSHYSLGCGTASPKRLVERAAALGLSALALTDTENLYGQVLFHDHARARGIHPICGAELRAAPPGGGSKPPSRRHTAGTPPRSNRLVLLARDQEGYANLCRVLTRRRLAGPLDFPASLRDLTSGLFVLAEDPLLLEELLQAGAVEPSQLRLLLVRPHPRIPEPTVLRASRTLGIPLVADPDIAFLDPEDHDLHRLLVAIATNGLLAEVDARSGVEPQVRHFPGPRRLRTLFADVPQAVAESRRLAAACSVELRRSRPIFPRIPIPQGETPYSHLLDLCLRGLRQRLGAIRRPYLDRLAQELRIIERLGFAEYFLVVGEIVRFARERGIEVVGRGSGAGSLVAYALGVTNVDPIRYRLHFERFLHPERPDLPDIDIDLCWIRRDEVIAHVYERYGDDRVAMISSHLTFQPHAALRETLKAFGVAPRTVDRWSRALPYVHEEVHAANPLETLLRKSGAARTLPLDEEPYKSAIRLAERLLNQPHHLSVHPGGIVIADAELARYVPLERAAKGVVVTQFEKDAVEAVGLVKIDLLGNRCLTEIQETLEWLRRGKDPIALDAIPDHDPAALELMAEGRTVSCFQLESPAMRNLLRKVRPRGVRDVIAAVALIRPGAAAGGAKEAYIRRRHGEEPVSYHHPSLRPLLEESYGVVLYEEDVMCIAAAIAGISRAEGDLLRTALKKCKGPGELRELEDRFLERAIASGIAPHTAREVWRDLKKFASYCFSKAHAAGYGLLAYQAAYLKAHFPAAFACAVLNHHAGMYSRRTIAEEVRRMGVPLLHPCVNRSAERFTLERRDALEEERHRGCGEPGARAEEGWGGTAWAVRIGLAAVKGLSTASRERIFALRPFRSLADFIRRASPPRREIEALILAGALDGVARESTPRDRPVPNHPQLLWELESTYEKERGRGELVFVRDEEYRLEPPPLPDYTPWERLQNELKVLEMTPSAHPLSLLRSRLAEEGFASTRKAATLPGRHVRVAGLVAASRKVRTAHGSLQQFVTIEDEEGLLEATLFPPICRRYADRMNRLGPYVFEGKVEVDHGAPGLIVRSVTTLPCPSRLPSPPPLLPETRDGPPAPLPRPDPSPPRK